MEPYPAGENDVALAPGYAANVEVASAEPAPVELPDGAAAPEEVATPGLTTVADVTSRLGVPAGTLLKAYPIIVEDKGLTLVMVRGDHRVNDIKLQNALGTGFRPAVPDEFAQRIGPGGYIGPGGADGPNMADHGVAPGAYAPAARSAPPRRSCSTTQSPRARTSPAPTATATTCAASSPGATSRSSAPTCA